AASSPTTTPATTARAARPAKPDRPRVGPLAIARLTVPTTSPNTSVNGTTTAIDTFVASVVASVATSQASAVPSSTTMPAITWLDRSYPQPGSGPPPPPSQVSGSAIRLADTETPNISRTCPGATGARAH